jgi:hypothetical protein
VIKHQCKLLFVTGLLCVSSNVLGLETFADCTVHGTGSFLTGEVFAGDASDILGVQSLDWTHDVAGLSFFTMTPGPSDQGVVCRRNGAISARFQGEMVATVNGVPGFGYIIDLEDNRAPAEERLCATLVQKPRTRDDASISFTAPRLAVIPAEIPVLLGGAGSGMARLNLDRIKCRYRGTGTNYAFERCAGPDGHALVPGDTVSYSEASLRVQSADRALPVTSVQVDIGAEPPPQGLPDSYTITITDTAGAPMYFFDGLLDCGDIDIVLDP